MFNKNNNKYRITVEEILDKNKYSENNLQFEAESHEDILKIVDAMKQNSDFDENEAASLGLGLKLFSGVMMNNKENPLFKNLIPAFKDFMKGLKGSAKPVR